MKQYIPTSDASKAAQEWADEANHAAGTMHVRDLDERLACESEDGVFIPARALIVAGIFVGILALLTTTYLLTMGWPVG